jgi:hypothetical protein
MWIEFVPTSIAAMRWRGMRGLYWSAGILPAATPPSRRHAGKMPA